MLNNEELVKQFDKIDDVIVYLIKKKKTKDEMEGIISELLLDGHFGNEYDAFLNNGFDNKYSDEIDFKKTYIEYSNENPSEVDSFKDEVLGHGIDKENMDEAVIEILVNSGSLTEFVLIKELKNGNEINILKTGINLKIKDIKRTLLNQNNNDNKNLK